jgi:hypothetical protein
MLQIPTKVEVFVGFASAADAAAAAAATTDQAAAAAAPANGEMKRLGYLSFDSNERSGYKARELKSVHITVNAQLVRLLIHRCHVNKHNIYNQVNSEYCYWGLTYQLSRVLEACHHSCNASRAHVQQAEGGSAGQLFSGAINLTTSTWVASSLTHPLAHFFRAILTPWTVLFGWSAAETETGVCLCDCTSSSTQQLGEAGCGWKLWCAAIKRVTARRQCPA